MLKIKIPVRSIDSATAMDTWPEEKPLTLKKIMATSACSAEKPLTLDDVMAALKILEKRMEELEKKAPIIINQPYPVYPQYPVTPAYPSYPVYCGVSQATT